MNPSAKRGASDVHPWLRFWARSFDGLLVAIPVGLVWWVYVPPAEIGWLTLTLFGMTTLFFVLLAEPLFVSRLGATPGKWVFGIRILNPDGSRLALRQALHRADMVWAKGLGAGAPFITPFLMAAQHYQLSRDAKTFWDEEGGFEVQHEPVRSSRVIGAIAFAVVVVLAVVLTVLEW